MGWSKKTLPRKNYVFFKYHTICMSSERFLFVFFPVSLFFVRIGIHFLPLLFKHLTTLVDLAKSNKKIIIWQRVEVTTSQFLEYNLIFSIFSQNIAVSEQTSTIILLDDWIILEIESFWLYSIIQYAYTRISHILRSTCN